MIFFNTVVRIQSLIYPEQILSFRNHSNIADGQNEPGDHKDQKNSLTKSFKIKLDTSAGDKKHSGNDPR
jgi:hypothetical protein